MEEVEKFNGYGVPENKQDWFIVLTMILLIFIIYKLNKKLKS